MNRRWITVSMLITALAVPEATSASPPVLRSGTRPFFATFGFGPALSVSNSLTQLKIEQSFGYHFSGNSAGPALGITLQESFGSQVFVFQPNARFWFDIPVSSDLGVYVTPTVGLGMAVVPVPNYGTLLAFDMQFGAEVRFVLGDRGVLFARPLGLDINVNGNGTSIRYDLVFGGGGTF